MEVVWARTVICSWPSVVRRALVGPKALAQRFEILATKVLNVIVGVGDALVTDFNDALGEAMDRSLIIGAIVLQLHDAVEALGAIARAQISVIVLKGLGDLRNHVPVHPVPERRDDCIDGLAALGPVHHLTPGECEPFPAAIVAFEIAA